MVLKLKFTSYILIIIMLLSGCGKKESNNSTNATNAGKSINNQKVSQNETENEKTLTLEEAVSITEKLYKDAKEFEDTLIYISVPDQEATGTDEYPDFEASYEPLPIPEDFKYKSFNDIEEKINSLYTEKTAEYYKGLYIGNNWFTEKDGKLYYYPIGAMPHLRYSWVFEKAKLLFNCPDYIILGVPFEFDEYYSPGIENDSTEGAPNRVTEDGILRIEKVDNEWKLASIINDSNNIFSDYLELPMTKEELLRAVKAELKDLENIDQYYFDILNVYPDQATDESILFRLELIKCENGKKVRDRFYFIDAKNGKVLEELNIEGENTINPDFIRLNPDSSADVEFLIGFWTYAGNDKYVTYEDFQDDLKKLSIKHGLTSDNFYYVGGDEMFVIVPKYLESRILLTMKNSPEIPPAHIYFDTSTYLMLQANESDLHANSSLLLESASGFTTTIEPQVSLGEKPEINVPKGVKDISDLTWENN